MHDERTPYALQKLDADKMKRAVLMIGLIAAAIALLASALWIAARCNADSVKGPAIGGVIKLWGC